MPRRRWVSGARPTRSRPRASRRRWAVSLGWLIQLDGDRRRNEFINSPWARVCMPMRRGREREAVGWLAKYLEGEVGYDAGSAGPLADLLEGDRAVP